MKTLGIIGGIGPESTIVYYRAIVAGFRERVRDGSLPPIIINSIDMKKLLDLVASDRAALTTFLSDEVERLARAGADVALFASNTFVSAAPGAKQNPSSALLHVSRIPLHE